MDFKNNMVRPNFFIVGAPKCGTTSMYYYLSQHPQVYMPEKVKEPHYFARDLHIPAMKKYRDNAKYLSLFDDANTENCIGEASVWYLFSRKAASEIYDFNPNAKIIIMLRNPVDMIYSLHSQLVFAGDEPKQSFEEAWASETRRKLGYESVPNMYAPLEAVYYRDVARYYEQVKRYLDIFGKTQVYVIIFDDLRHSLDNIYHQVAEFLAIDPEFRPNFANRNSNKRVKNRLVFDFLNRNKPTWFANKIVPFVRCILPLNIRQVANTIVKSATLVEEERPPLNTEMWANIQQVYNEDMKNLQQLINRDLSQWLQKSE